MRHTTMTGWYVERMVIVAGQRANERKQTCQRFLLGLHAPILRGTDHTMRLGAPAGVQELEHMCCAVSDMHPHAGGRDPSDRLDTVPPDVRFFLTLATLGARFSGWDRGADERFLVAASQHVPSAGINGDEKPVCFSVSLSHEEFLRA